MLTWLGRTLYHFRRVILLAACVITGIAVVYGSGVFDALNGTTTIEDTHSQSAQAQILLDTKLKTGSVDVVILMSNPTLKATDAAFAHAANQLLNKLKTRSEINMLTSYYSTSDASLISHDGHETIALLRLSTRGDRTDNYEAITPLITSPLLHIEVGGTVVAEKQFNQQVSADLAHAESITLPIVVLLLIIIFGGLVAALLPLLIGGVAIVFTFAILRLLANFFNVSSFAINVTSFIGLGLAIDYSLFIVTRFREELVVDEADVCGALQRTMTTAGRTIIFSGLTVGTSLVALLLFPEVLLQSIGLAAMATALLAMLTTLIVLPVLLAILGRHVNALSFQHLFGRRKFRSSIQKQGAWYHFSYRVMRWSIPVTVVTVGILLFLGSPFLHASFSTADENVLPPGSSSAIVLDHLTRNFSNQNSTEIDIVIRTHGSATSATNLAALSAYTQHVKALPGITSITSLVNVDPRLTLTDYQQIYAHPSVNSTVAAVASQLANSNLSKVIVMTNYKFDSTSATSLVNQIRVIPIPGSLVPLVAGDTATQIDLFASLRSTIPYALLIMAGAIFILLFLMTGSLIMPLKAVILNVLSLSATFGGLVWIFQEGHLQNLLGFQSIGSLDSTQPVLIFAIAFGLSMDYEVFLLCRIKEQFDKTGNNREAVAVGLQRTGQLITSAALLLAIVVGAFATSKILIIQQIGLGVAIAIIMDATLVRILLVPAMMNLLGKWNWWAPRPLQALQKRIGLSEGAEPEPTSEAVLSLPEASLKAKV
ncbi:MAG: MMPL family transporter [Ktedonobacteraceae bacterium]